MSKSMTENYKLCVLDTPKSLKPRELTSAPNGAGQGFQTQSLWQGG